MPELFRLLQTFYVGRFLYLSSFVLQHWHAHDVRFWLLPVWGLGNLVLQREVMFRYAQAIRN